MFAADDLPPASVRGVVRDASGSPLRRVEVQLIDLTTGKINTTSSDVAGGFGFENLASGRYTLGFFLEGYAAERLPAQELLPGPPIEIVVTLKRLAAPLTRPTSGIETIALEYGMVREQIASAPTLLGSEGRTIIDKLALLTPGLTPVEALEIDPFTGTASAVSANGSRRSAVNYQLDGAHNNAQNRLTGSQAATYAPAPEAVETFRAVTHTYSAAEGRNAGAIVAPTTRTGSEQWHGQLRFFPRPHSGVVESFDDSRESLGGWAAGGQVGGPLWAKRKIDFLFDAEGWRTTRRRTTTSSVLSLAERSGDLSHLMQAPIDPGTNAPFPNGMIPDSALDPLMRDYLAAFVPEPNVGEEQYRSREDYLASGEMLLGRIDWKPSEWSIHVRHVLHRNAVDSPVADILAPSPGLTEQRKQTANNAQVSAAWSPTPSFTQTTRLSGQRLSVGRWRGIPAYRGVTANEFGFDFGSFGANPGTIPDVTLYDDAGFVRMRIAPFLSSDNSVQTTWQINHDAEYRKGWATLRGGALYRNGRWPFVNTENFAGSFSFPAPPEPPIRSRPNGLRDLLIGLPGQYRLQTPRSLNLSWEEIALYGEGELQPLRNLRVTLGVRFESQPPATDSLDRIAAFRADAESERFPNTLDGLIFPGDADPDRGGVPLPRSTVYSDGRNIAPRIGLAYSPTSNARLSRWVLGEPGRAAIRASYGLFYDFGAFAGSSSSALFQATYPPFSVDNRFDFSRTFGQESFRRPFASTGEDPAQFVPNLPVRYPIRVFSPDFQNARAHQWNLGLQRVLSNGVFVSAVYVGTRSLRLQRQRELNEFVRNPLFGFSAVRSMRLFSRYAAVREFESEGSGRYNGLQLRANRYLRRGLAFDLGYTWSRSDDNGSNVFGEELATEPWTVSNFDRRHNLTASWVWESRLPRGASPKLRMLDRWTIAGVWRSRSGLPLDVRQNEDPTFSFELVGRPDVFAPFERLNPGTVRTFTTSDGREVTGRFAFDPTIFAPVAPTNFNETRPGNVGRNAFRMRGYQQWDFRLSRPIEISERVTGEIGLDVLNAFGNRNYAAPFANIDQPYFGIVRTEGLRRTFQAAIRLGF